MLTKNKELLSIDSYNEHPVPVRKKKNEKHHAFNILFDQETIMNPMTPSHLYQVSSTKYNIQSIKQQECRNGHQFKIGSKIIDRFEFRIGRRRYSSTFSGLSVFQLIILLVCTFKKANSSHQTKNKKKIISNLINCKRILECFIVDSIENGQEKQGPMKFILKILLALPFSVFFFQHKYVTSNLCITSGNFPKEHAMESSICC